MTMGSKMRPARALPAIDQKRLAELSGVSMPTIQRMETSKGNVRGVVESLTRIIKALDRSGVELIGENIVSTSTGRGVRLKQHTQALHPEEAVPQTPAAESGRLQKA